MSVWHSCHTRRERQRLYWAGKRGEEGRGCDCVAVVCGDVGTQGPHKNSGSHIDASHSRQPLVKGERLVRYEVNAVMP